MDDIESEIEKLKIKKVEIVHKINSATSFDEKEDFREYLDTLQKQIDLLENMKIKQNRSDRKLSYQ